MRLIKDLSHYYSQRGIKTTFSALLALISLFVMFFFPESGLAQQGFKWKRMEIHPALSFQMNYNSNIFLNADKVFVDGTSEVAQEDFIFTTSPSLTIEQKRQKGDNFGFFFQYLGQDERYVELKDQDFYTQDVSAHLELGDLGGGITWTFGGRYLDSRDPISTEFGSIFNPRQDRTTYDLHSKLLWKLTHDIEADIEAKVRRNLFDNFDLEEFDQYNGSSTLFWKSTALTGIGVNYSFQYIDYLEASTFNFDNARHSGSFILRWKPLSVFSSEFWIGMNHVKVIDVAGQDRDDVIYKLQLDYQPNTTSKWRLTSFREIPNSFLRDIQSFQSTATQLTWSQKLGVKWKGLSTISFEDRKYDIPIQDIPGGGALKLREDQYFFCSLSLTYSIQDWLSASMEYSYTNNDSNFDEADYSRNLVFLRLSFTL